MLTKEQRDEILRLAAGLHYSPHPKVRDKLIAYVDSITVPDGWQVVPVEPTQEMIDAARQHHEGEAYLPFGLYKAMLAAAPKPGDSNE